MAFSIIRNYKDLTAISPEDIPGLYFGKVAYMFFIVLGHRIIFFYSYPLFSSESIEKDLYSEGNYLIGFFYCGFIMVESFFLFSGFVSFITHLAKIRVKGWLGAIEDTLYRWAKMIPVHMYTIIILSYVMPHLNNGPLWYRTVVEAERCRSNIWSNFFAVSNIFGTEKMCLFHTWYPSADIQLAMIGSILLVLYSKNEKLGIYLTISAFAGGTTYTFMNTYVNKYHAVLPVFISTFYSGRNTQDFLNSYISTSIRTASYMIGFATGIITKKLTEINFKFPEGSIFFIVLASLCSKMIIIGYIPQLSEFTKEYDQLENAIGAAIIRSIFVLPEAVFCCAYVTARQCKYLLFFDKTVWIPLGRLLYGIFVISVVIQLYHTASHQVLMPSYSLIYIFWLFVGDIIYSIFGAFVLYLMIQGPMFNLLKICIKLCMRKIYMVSKAVEFSTNGTSNSIQSVNRVTRDKKL